MFIWSSTPAFARAALTPGRLIDFREQLTSVDGLAGISHLSVNLTGGGDPERLPASSVSSGFFDVLGVAAAHRRYVSSRQAEANDVVLSYGLWTRRFGSDRTLVGREITVNGRSRRVAAVMPPEFAWPAITGRGSSSATPPQLWLPGAGHDIPRTPGDDPNQDLSANRRIGYLRAVGRLKDGATIAQAQGEAERSRIVWRRTIQREDGGTGVVVQPMREQLFGVVRQPLLILVGAVAFVLAIACANAPACCSAARRSTARDRRAPGARRQPGPDRPSAPDRIDGPRDRRRVWRRRDCVVGAVVADRSGAGRDSRLADTGIDATVLAFTLAVSLATGVFFGIVPAWQASTGTLTADLGEANGRGSAGPPHRPHARRAGRGADCGGAGPPHRSGAAAAQLQRA